MTVRVLGPLDTGAEASLSPRERAILSALVVLAGASVSSDELAEAYWGERPPRTWPQQVKTSVARIRDRLGHDSVVTRGSHYALGIDPNAIDAFEFERLISQARKHALHGEHDRAIDAYRRGLGLWRGQAFPELPDWEPARNAAARLAEIRRSAEEELLEERLNLGAHREIIAEAEQAVRTEPLREDRWAILAMANYRAGRQAEALATIRSAREHLAHEVGIELSPRLRQLETAILRQDAALDAVPAPPLPDVLCPYPGLAPFGPEDAERFFGRQDEIDAILSRIRSGAILAVVGASGSGKSSLVLAGVIPRERESGRRSEILQGGPTLVPSLRAVLHHLAAPEIIVIDQAEAIFQLGVSEVESAGALIDDALRLGSAIVLTVRSDFLDRAIALPHIGSAVARGLFALGPLSEEGLRQAVIEPAAGAGLRIEPVLVERIVRDAGDSGTTLPHVSHALLETWVRREGSTLTIDGYEDSGGITGAIAQSAEMVYQSMPAADALVCRALMLRLVQRDADGRSVRRPTQLAPLRDDEQRRRVLEQLIATRLLTSDGETIVVAHEAIATAWPRLDAWLEEDAEGARLVAAVAAAADLWNGSGRRDEDLLRGSRLKAALDWRDGSEPDLTTVERDLLTTSAGRERDEVRELAQRAARENRNNRRLRWAVAGSGVLLVAAIVGGGVAVVRGGEAELAAENERVEALVATSLALLDNDRETAALLAAESFRRWPDDPRVRSALWGVMTSAGGLVDTHHDEGAWLPAMDMIPGTTRAVRVSSFDDRPGDTAADVVDIATGEVVRTFHLDLPESPPDRGSSVAVSPDGSIAAIQTPVYPEPSKPEKCCWIHLTFFNLRTGEQLPGTRLVRANMTDNMAFDAAGGTLYAANPITADIIAVDSATGEIRASSTAVFDDHFDEPQRFYGVALIDDGLVAAGAGDRILLYDRATLRLARTIPLDGDMASEELVADGQGGIVTTGSEGTARVLLATGETLWRRFPDPTRNCYTLHLTTPTTVACGSIDGVALLDLATGETRGARAALQLNELPQLETIDDESLLVTVFLPPVWMRWRVDGGGAGADIVAAGRELVDGPEDGGTLVVTQPLGGGPQQLWDLRRDAPFGEEADRIVPLGSGVVARYADFDFDAYSGEPRLERSSTREEIRLRVPGLPDSFNVLPGSSDHAAFAWWKDGVVAFDPSTGEPLGPLMTLRDSPLTEVASASETPDAALAVITWGDGAGTETAVFDIQTGELLARGLTGLERSQALPGDQLVGVAQNYARRYDIRTLEPISVLARAIGGSQLLSVSADGRTLLSVGFNNALTLYDLTADIALATPLDGDVFGPYLRGGYLTSDGETLLETLPDGIRVWDLRLAEQAADACALAGRELTEEEWSTYFPGEERIDTCAELG